MGALSGVVISAILPVLGTFGVLFSLFGLLGGILAVFTIKYFGTGYLIGWLFGILIIGSFGLEEPSLVIGYLMIGTIVLIGRIVKSINDL